RARTPAARPAARKGLRGGARPSLGGGQGRCAPRVGVGPSLPRGPPVPAAGPGGVKHAYHKWHSPALGRDMELQVLGHAGARVLVFPTSLGSYSEWTDRRMDRPRRRRLQQEPGVLRNPLGQGNRERAEDLGRMVARLALLGEDDPALYRGTRLKERRRRAEPSSKTVPRKASRGDRLFQVHGR